MLALSTSSFWLILGVVLLALEAFGAPGIGLIFAGLAALSMGALVQMDLLNVGDYITQGALFLLLTAAWTLLLWKPLQKFRLKVKNKPVYDSLLGAAATVHGGPLTKDREGQVIWSGTIMAAELAPDTSVEELPVGARVTVADVRGALVIVRPK